MRLLTHNMLMCNKKGVQNGFPLRIKAEKLVYEETEFNPVFIQHMIRKLEYPALLQAIEYTNRLKFIIILILFHFHQIQIRFLLNDTITISLHVGIGK